jgi:endonuclease/exonuclease/phosphatase (EEP) superfamily protein YafD
MFLLYLAPVTYIAPSLALLIAALIRRNRSAAILALASAAIVVGGIMKPVVTVAGRRHPAGNTVRVMQYNVEKWATGASRIAEVIRGINPDVVCLEEADNYWYTQPGATQLAKLLPDYHWAHENEIVIGTKYPILSERVYHIQPDEPTRPTPALEIDVHGASVIVLATHLMPVPWGAPATWQKLGEQRRTEIGNLVALQSRLNIPWILCGDFNMPADGLAFRALTRYANSAFDRSGLGFGYTLSAAVPVERVDHIFTDRSITPQRTWVPNIVESDHRPLVSELSIRGCSCRDLKAESGMLPRDEYMGRVATW